MRLFSFLQRNKTPAREPVGMASPAEQVQAARARARRRLVGAVVLLGLGIVGFPLLFETQPRPLPVGVTIEIPRKDGGAPLVLPPRVAPITESADEGGREVPPPVAEASAPAVRPLTVQPPAPAVVPVQPVTPAAAAAASAPRPAASAPRAAAGASQATQAAAPAQLPPPIKVLPDTPAAERRPAVTVAREATPPAREPQREASRDKPPVKEPTKEPTKEAAREPVKDKEPARDVAKDKPAVKEAARDKEPARDKDPIRELVKDKEKDKERAEAAVEKRYVVQVGAFADAASASEARARVEKLGIRSYTQEIQTEAGRRIRVRVGPFASREEADKALGKLRAAGLATALLPQP